MSKVASSDPGPITQLLAAASAGEEGAADRLWAVVYDELRRLARAQLAAESPHRALDSTALVHEAFLRLTGRGPVEWDNRRHFFAAAARAMRRIRVDDARRRKRAKRGDGRPTRSLTGDPPTPGDDPAEVLAIDEALRKLEREAPRQAEIVMLRYFAGLSIRETALALGVSVRTVHYDWQFARAWLHRELGGDGGPADGENA